MTLVVGNKSVLIDEVVLVGNEPILFSGESVLVDNGSVLSDVEFESMLVDEGSIIEAEDLWFDKYVGLKQEETLELVVLLKFAETHVTLRGFAYKTYQELIMDWDWPRFIELVYVSSKIVGETDVIGEFNKLKLIDPFNVVNGDSVEEFHSTDATWFHLNSKIDSSRGWLNSGVQRREKQKISDRVEMNLKKMLMRVVLRHLY